MHAEETEAGVGTFSGLSLVLLYAAVNRFGNNILMTQIVTFITLVYFTTHSQVNTNGILASAIH